MLLLFVICVGCACVLPVFIIVILCGSIFFVRLKSAMLVFVLWLVVGFVVVVLWGKLMSLMLRMLCVMR